MNVSPQWNAIVGGTGAYRNATGLVRFEKLLEEKPPYTHCPFKR